MAEGPEKGKGKDTGEGQGKDQEMVEGGASSNSPEPQESHEESDQLVESKDSHKSTGLSAAPIASTSSAAKSKPPNTPLSPYSFTVNVPVPEPLNVIKASTDDLSFSQDSGNTVKPGAITSPVEQNPIEIQAQPGNVELESRATSSEQCAQISTDEKPPDDSPSNQSSSPNLPVAQDTSPPGLQGSIKSQSSPPTPYDSGKEFQKLSYSSLKFIEEEEHWDENWDGDGGPVGTQHRDPNVLRSNAHLLGNPPPVVSGPSRAEIDAQERFATKEANEGVATDSQQQRRIPEEVLQLRTKVESLKKAGKPKMPAEMTAWREFTDTHSRGETTNLTVRDVIDLGNGAIEAAIQRGDEQASRLLILQHENDQLRREVGLLRKDMNAGTDYPSPDEYEEIKAEWEEDLRISSVKLKKAKDELKVVREEASLSNQYQTEATKEKQKNRRLGEELGELRIERDDIERDKLAYEDQVATLRNALDEEKSRNTALEGRKDRTLPRKSHSENEERDLRLKVVELEKKDKVRSEHIRVLLARVHELQGEETPPYQPSASDSGDSQLKTSERVSEGLKEEVEDVINPIEIAILRIKLRLGNLVRERDRCGTQPGDVIETAEIAEIAWDTLKLCEKLGDESALVRVSFWVGVVFYYNDNIQQARSYFQKANIPEVLPEYEVTYIAGWLQRCNESRPDTGSADIEASPSHAT